MRIAALITVGGKGACFGKIQKTMIEKSRAQVNLLYGLIGEQV